MLFKRRGLKDQGLPRGHYLEHFWHADLGYIGQAIIGVKVPNSDQVASIQHQRVMQWLIIFTQENHQIIGWVFYQEHVNSELLPKSAFTTIFILHSQCHVNDIRPKHNRRRAPHENPRSVEKQHCGKSMASPWQKHFLVYYVVRYSWLFILVE